jgi:hypothetical protein
MALKAIKPSDKLDTAIPREEILASFFIDWTTFWNRDQSAEDWLVWPLVPVGRGVALYAPAKAGKSLVILSLVAAAATGRKGLDGSPTEPIDVMYLDYEMTQDDLQERLEDMGYGPDDDMSRLHYASLPSLPPLNTEAGALRLLELVSFTDAKLVVIDTLGRAVLGEENSNDTAQDFYYWTGRALKTAGVAFLRADHAGKDLTRGQRGGSAKNDDVDLVWQLTRIEGGVKLLCTHRRISWVPESLQVSVDSETGWRFELVKDEVYPDGTKELAELMDRLGLDLYVSQRQAQAAIRASGESHRNDKIRAAVRWRKAAEPVFGGAENGRGTRRGTLYPQGPGHASGHTEGTSDVEPSDQEEYERGTRRGTRGTRVTDKTASVCPPLGGTRAESPPSEGEEAEEEEPLF